MKKFAVLFAVLVAIFGFIGWGENYIAQQGAEDVVETAARREQLMDEFEEVFHSYCEAEGIDAAIRRVTVDENGVLYRIRLCESDDIFVGETYLEWSDFQQITAEGRAWTMAALYSE